MNEQQDAERGIIRAPVAEPGVSRPVPNVRDAVVAAVLEASPDGVVVHDGTQVRAASERLLRTLGRRDGTLVGLPLVGLPLADLVAAADRDRVLHHVARGDGTPIEADLLRADGSSVPVELHPRVVHAEGEEVPLVVVRDLSALRRRERELAALADNSPDVLARFDRELRIRFVNATAERAFGHPRAALIGRPVSDLRIPPPLAELWTRGLRHVLETGEPAAGEFTWEPGDGREPRFFRARLTPEWDAPPFPAGGDARPASVLVTSRDVTDRRRAEKRAHDAGALLEALFDQVAVGIGVARASDGRFVRVNPACAAIFGYTVDEMLDLTIADVTRPEDHATRGLRTERLLAGEVRAETLERLYVRKDGATVWTRASVSALRGGDGAVTHLVGVVQDVSEWKRAEEALRRRERVLRDGEHLAGFGSWAWEAGTESVTWSDEIYRIFGFDPPFGRVTQSEFYARLHPEDRDAVMRLVNDTAARRGSHDTHYRIMRPDGTVRLLRERAFAEVDPDGGAVRLAGVTQDVTEREAAERALREREERFRALVEHGSDVIVILDADGTKRYVTGAYQAVLGYAPEEVLGRNAFDFVHPDDAATFRAAIDATAAGGGPTRSAPIRFRHRDGRWRALLGVLTDLRASPAVCGIVANARDVTDQLELEERLRQSQKLEALGQLAGGVAHDFNNILAAIVGYGQMLRDALAAGDPRRDDAEEVVRAAARGTDLTRQLLAFSRRQAIATEVLDLTAVARETARMLRPLLPASIALVPPADDAPPALVRAGRAQVAQIVINLAVNARDAMPDGGTLTLDVRLASGEHGRPAAQLVVRDTGVGISPETRERLFEPFFTTKPTGLGTGLGLATVYGLTRQFDGTVAVESEVGRGTTFTVTLPVTRPGSADAPAAPNAPNGFAAPNGSLLPNDAAARRLTPRAMPTVPAATEGERPAERPSAASAATSDARRRVLVVEDEAAIRTIARRALESAGYEAILDADAAHALDRLRAGEPFDLVLTDAAMPVVSGWRLAAEVAAMGQPIPVVLMSGFAELSDARHAQSRPELEGTGVVDFLEKPFSTRHLVEVVTRALARRAP